MRPTTRRPIVTRLVVAVAATMAVVLAGGAAFVYWRVSFALSRQLDRDLRAYREVAESAIQRGQPLVSDTPGQRYQTYAADGRITGGDAGRRLAPVAVVREIAAHGGSRSADVGSVIPAQAHPYRYVVARVRTPSGYVVAAYEISRRNHDEALRELLLQLVLVGLATLAAASVVGYRTARAALDPVERYRRAAATAGEDDRLPVADRDDELSRLGHTLNELLDRIAAGAARERHFLADASHELRGPLTVMRAEVDLARMRHDDPTATAQALESLSGQIGRLVVLCNALLDLEELRAQPEPGDDTVQVRDLTDDVVDRWRSRATEAGRTVDVAVPDDLVVRGRMQWLDVALDNLVSNALRYGAGTVRIGAASTGGHAAGDRRVAIWVEDDGPGFDPEFAHRAFDRFARADESRSSGGVGLGLALVAAVAETHHGTVAIEGSRVTLSLPAGRPGHARGDG
jgi:signal transduction histidine kinase